MEIGQLVTASITVGLAVVGWVVGHRVTSLRDLRNKRLELRTKYLLTTYLNLDRSLNRTVTPEILCDLEDAVSVLQLFGSDQEIKDTIEVARSLSGNHPESMDVSDFLASLRNSLRRELGLSPYHGPIANLRLTLGGKDPRSLVRARHGQDELKLE
jgi:hypothetical protein